MRRITDTAVALAAAILLAGCGDEPLRPLPYLRELDRASRATEKYQDIARAIADGYVDANIVTQSMGHHYLNASLVDGRFDIERPELLVYAPQDGRMQLVAVEYAVPLGGSSVAPNGFTGAADEWERSTKYGLWTLHAWLWRENGDGVFAPMNQDVQLDPDLVQGAVHGRDH